MEPSNIKTLDLAQEKWREYEFGPQNFRTTYRISAPTFLYLKEGGTTHRVQDTFGVIHCIPAPGFNGCVLRWEPRDTTKPVQF